MSMSDSSATTPSGSSSRRKRPVLVGLVIGGAATAFVLRRQVAALAKRAVPYARRTSRVSSPVLIVNRWSGDGKAERYGLAEAAREAGIDVIMLERGDDIVELAANAVDAGADAIGAAGGDGSLGLVAGVAIERDVPFFCVPVGTRNHFALDLGLDRDNPLTALDAIRDGEEIDIDYGLAGERPFLNNVSFGIYAEAVHRPEYRENKEETVAAVMREMHADGGSGSAIRFATPQGEQAEQTAVTLASNNPYVYSGPPDYGRRTRLDTGVMGITTYAQGTTAAGRATEGARHWEADELVLESDNPILAGLDGEALTFEPPLVLRIVPKGLRVLVPRGTKPGYVPPAETFAAQLIGLNLLAGLGGEPDQV